MDGLEHFAFVPLLEAISDGKQVPLPKVRLYAPRASVM
jgi:hypothetical protein